MDILGPLPQSVGKVKFVIMAIDYFTKWIKAKPLARITVKEVKRYESEALILAEIGMPTHKMIMIREDKNEDKLCLNMDLLQERREATPIREAKYKAKMEQYYNQRIRLTSFKPGEIVPSCFVFSTWMSFGGNTSDLGAFREEIDEIMDLRQILEDVLLIERGDGVASIKRRRRDLFCDDVWNLETASGRGRLKEDLESST
ncbi:reverse transcriptase domain-containing protein [Tanacetum coccineum]